MTAHCTGQPGRSTQSMSPSTSIVHWRSYDKIWVEEIGQHLTSRSLDVLGRSGYLLKFFADQPIGFWNDDRLEHLRTRYVLSCLNLGGKELIFWVFDAYSAVEVDNTGCWCWWLQARRSVGGSVDVWGWTCEAFEAFREPLNDARLLTICGT